MNYKVNFTNKQQTHSSMHQTDTIVMEEGGDDVPPPPPPNHTRSLRALCYNFIHCIIQNPPLAFIIILLLLLLIENAFTISDTSMLHLTIQQLKQALLSSTSAREKDIASAEEEKEKEDKERFNTIGGIQGQ